MNSSLVEERYPTNMEFRLRFLPLAASCHRWVTPLLILTGILGNTVSFFVWTDKRIRRNNSSATYLAALSLSDLILLLTHSMHYLKFAWRLGSFDYKGVCQLFQMIYIIFQYNSSPLVFSFTLERWIAVCYPLKRERWCTSCRAFVAIAVISALMLPIGVVQAFGWSTGNNSTGVCKFHDSWQRNFLVTVFSTVVELVMSAGFPIGTLAFNILVVVELRHISLNSRPARTKTAVPGTGGGSIRQQNSVRKRFSIFNKDKKVSLITDDKDIIVNMNLIKDHDTNISNITTGISTQHQQPQKPPKLQKVQSSGGVNFRSTTVMLLSVSFYQIVTTLPTGAVYLSQFLIGGGDSNLTDAQILADPGWTAFMRLQTAKEFVDVFSLTHYCFNVLIYLLTGRQFRRYLLQTLRLDTLCCGESESAVAGGGAVTVSRGPANTVVSPENNSRGLSFAKKSNCEPLSNHNNIVIVNKHQKALEKASTTLSHSF